jgi:hypothetical protein
LHLIKTPCLKKNTKRCNLNGLMKRCVSSNGYLI